MIEIVFAMALVELHVVLLGPGVDVELDLADERCPLHLHVHKVVSVGGIDSVFNLNYLEKGTCLDVLVHLFDLEVGA